MPDSEAPDAGSPGAGALDAAAFAVNSFAAAASAAAASLGPEAWLDRWIRESSRARELLERLDGRRLAIVVRGLGIRLHMDAVGTRLALSLVSSDAAAARAAATATATVEGTPLALLGLLDGARPEAFRNSGARLSGDAQTAAAFAELLRHARPDIEEELSRLIGDIAAHEVAGAARRADVWARRAGAALIMNTSEFLQEEARQLPPRAETDAFGRDVERLRDDVERAAQRLGRIEAVRRRQPARDAAPLPERRAATAVDG